MLGLVALWLTLPLASFAHGDDHAHRFCAEHGTIEEGAASAAHSDGAAGLAWMKDVAADADVHAPCPVATAPTRDAQVEWTVPPASPVQAAPALLPEPPAPGYAALPLLALAPKASPPAAS